MEITRRTSTDFSRIFDILAYQLAKYPNKKALNSFLKGRWEGISIQDIQKRSEAIGCWFIKNGFTKGDKVLFVPEMGKPEWLILDFACQQAGLIVVPVHPTSRAVELDIILSETEARICIVADVGLYYKFQSLINETGKKVDLYHLDPTERSFFKPLTLSKIDETEFQQLKEIRDGISAHDTLAIMYTSGSSGVPKGVVLSHHNVVSSVKASLTLLPLELDQSVLSFLPFSHVFERVACYGYMAFGVSIFFGQNKNTFTHDFKTVRPVFCTGVPRVLEKMYDFIQEQTLSHSLIKRKVIRWAMMVGQQYHPNAIKPVYRIKLAIARLLVLRQWRNNLGGRMRYMVVGAASLRPEIGKLMSASGIMVAEGYGMTETAPFISVNRFEPGLNRFGTVGLIIPGVQVKIDQPDESGDGEILVKGDNVMKGYFKRPDLNKDVFTDDGWFRTGDVGTFVDGKFLKITDRKKDIFKTSTGKYIAPLPLQNHFKKSPFIEKILIVGFQKPFVAALIVPNFQLLENWCHQEDVHWTAPEFMVYNIKVRSRFQQEIDALNEELPSHERVRDFVLCHQDWSVESGELTTTLKPVRHLLMEHYQKEIDRIYE